MEIVEHKMNWKDFVTKLEYFGFILMFHRETQYIKDDLCVAPLNIKLMEIGKDLKYITPRVSFNIICQQYKPTKISEKHYPKINYHEIADLPTKDYYYTYLLITDGEIKPFYVDKDFTFLYNKIIQGNNIKFV